MPGISPRRTFVRSPRLTFSERLSTKCLLWLNSSDSIYLPCGVFSNQKCGNLRSTSIPSSSRYNSKPLSTGLRDNRSGSHEIIPSASPYTVNNFVKLCVTWAFGGLLFDKYFDNIKVVAACQRQPSSSCEPTDNT